MNKENTEKLLKRFPDLYQQYFLSAQETCLVFGFECGDGWFDLIWELSLKLEKYSEEDNLQASQVKEKYASLRFYTNYCNDEADALIDAAERKSAKTCEVCGKPGKLDCTSGWYSTTCKKHKYKARQEE